jgi:hypothetical protein
MRLVGVEDAIEIVEKTVSIHGCEASEMATRD